MMALLETDWFIWGIGLILGFQILVVMLGELLYRADRRRLPIAPILRAARNVVLPLLVAQVFVVRVLEVPVETIPARIVATALWISLLYTGLLLVNVLVFEQAPEGTWRHRAPSLFQDLVRMLLVTVGAAIVLAVVWEQDLGGLIAALGVGSIVLGLALQETLGNLMSGIALLFEKPFSIGDWIEVGDDQGEVVEINWRSVHVRTRERNLLVFPNSVLGRETIINYARPSALQTLRLSFGFSLDDPPTAVKAALMDVADDMDPVLKDPAPKALLREVLDDRMRYEVFLFIDQARLIPQIVDTFTSRLWYSAQRRGLHLPLPSVNEYHMQATDGASAAPVVDVVAELERAQAFGQLDRATLITLAEQARLEVHGDGERLLDVGEVAAGISVIVSGAAVARLRLGEDIAEVKFAPGDLLGVTSSARREPSEFRIEARGDVVSIVIDHELVDALMQEHLLLASQLARLMEVRRETMQQAREMLLHGDGAVTPPAETLLPVIIRKPQTEPDPEPEPE